MFTIRTFPTGRIVDLVDPRPEQIHILDIVHHLSYENRFNGATKIPYPVLAHSLFVEKIALDLVDLKNPNISDNYKIYISNQALFHDGAEAYLKDIPKPLKEYFRTCKLEYDKLEMNMLACICKAMKIDDINALKGPAKEADKIAQSIENCWLRPTAEKEIPLPENLSIPKESIEHWLSVLEKITNTSLLDLRNQFIGKYNANMYNLEKSS